MVQYGILRLNNWVTALLTNFQCPLLDNALFWSPELIGFEVVKKLIQRSPHDLILLGSRSLQRGQEALKQLGSPSNVHILKLDMSSKESIERATQKIKDQYDHLDIIINNAGIARPNDTSLQAAKDTIAVNYHGVKMLNDNIIGLLPQNGRVINVSSAVGCWTFHNANKKRQEQFASDDLTADQLDQLVDEYIRAAEKNEVAALGYGTQFPFYIYGFSKMALNALSRVEAREWKDKRILVVAVGPGYCFTDMTHHAPDARPASMGADSILHVVDASADELENGTFYQDGEQKPQGYPISMDMARVVTDMPKST